MKNQIEIGKRVGRNDWIEKNTEKLITLEKFLERINKEKLIHKNGDLRGGTLDAKRYKRFRKIL